MSITNSNQNLFLQVKSLLQNAKKKVVANINYAMVTTYFQVGRLIVEDEQKGKNQANYGEHTLINLSFKLKDEFGRGFSVQNLENMRTFYMTYNKIYQKSQTLSGILYKRQNMLDESHKSEILL
jgi:hypothetical protein